MNLAIFRSRFVPTCACVLVCMLGCGESKQSLHEIDHVIPAHWPNDLSDAAGKLRERLTRVQATSFESAHGSDQTLKELSDLVGWVPEVAADTDLAESDWMKLYSASEKARRQLLASNRVDSELAQDIDKLCSLLIESQALIPPTLVLVDDSNGEKAAELEPQE